MYLNRKTTQKKTSTAESAQMMFSVMTQTDRANGRSYFMTVDFFQVQKYFTSAITKADKRE